MDHSPLVIFLSYDILLRTLFILDFSPLTCYYMHHFGRNGLKKLEK